MDIAGGSNRIGKKGGPRKRKKNKNKKPKPLDNNKKNEENNKPSPPITNDASKNENQESSERRSRTKERKNKAQQKELIDDTFYGEEEEEEEEEYVMSHYDKTLKDIPSPPPSSSYPSSSSHSSSDLSNLKERFNYASHVCAAMVLNTNTGAKFAHAILTESKDQYMLNECDAGKFVVVQLCNDILIDTIVLANFEFFSSTFKHIRISANNEHPPRKERPWRLLGEYKAGNTRDLQVGKKIHDANQCDYLATGLVYLVIDLLVKDLLVKLRFTSCLRHTFIRLRTLLNYIIIAVTV